MEKNEVFEFQVRDLRMEDLERLRPILEYWIKDRNTGEPLPKEVEQGLDAMRASLMMGVSQLYIVATNSDGQPIGVVGLKNLDWGDQGDVIMLEQSKTDRPVELVRFYIHPEARNQGVGRRLVESLAEIAADLGYLEIILNSGPRYRESAWPFYMKVFGEPIAIATEYYGVGGDAPIWSKIL